MSGQISGRAPETRSIPFLELHRIIVNWIINPKHWPGLLCLKNIRVKSYSSDPRLKIYPHTYLLELFIMLQADEQLTLTYLFCDSSGEKLN